MSFLITHFYEGGTDEQYRAVSTRYILAAGFRRGSSIHPAAGPADGGWLIAAVWDSEASFDKFVS